MQKSLSMILILHPKIVLQLFDFTFVKIKNLLRQFLYKYSQWLLKLYFHPAAQK